MDPTVTTCYRHPDQPAGVICQRCDRPICPRCMHQASVGFHCPECARTGRQRVVQGSAAFAGGRVVPVLTYVLIGINVAVFLIGILVDGASAIGGVIGRMQYDFALFAKGLIPSDGGWVLAGVGEGQWYRIVTSGFLHYGIFHIAVNMYALYLLGRVLEVSIGRLRTGAIYGASLVAGALGALIASPGSLTAGASGAIFGLMGALLMLLRAQGIPFRDSPLLPTLALNLALTLFFVRYVSVGGHFGGFVGGVICGWLLFDVARRPAVPKWAPLALTGAVAMVCVVGSIVVAGNYTG
ncbi:MAG: rhomboid family intramembrane serine protease [Actinobacteria bacterium]|nr:rhomboid family intramembrane serine protease [Actinomycetota bacterium]